MADPHLAVGIDVVDLEDPRSADRSRDARLLGRILTPGELRFVREAGDADLALWSLWAGKEAGFKAVTLLEGTPPVFHHAAFEVTLGGIPSERGSAGQVTYRGRSLPLRVLRRGSCLVALAWGQEEGEGTPGPRGLPADISWNVGTVEGLSGELAHGEATLDEIRAGHFSPSEARAVHSLPSALARLAVRRAAAALLETDEGRLAVICAEGAPGRVPPALHLDGAPRPGVALSISHHRAWIGWALRAPAAGSGAGG